MSLRVASTFSSLSSHANSLLFGCSASNIVKLQCVQNTAACVVLDTQRPCPTQQLFHHLHWLHVHVRFCFSYKIATFTYKVLACNRPLYLSRLVTTYTPAHTLPSQDKHLLAISAVSSVIGRRGFSCAAPSIWSEIPVKIFNIPSLASFKKHLKAHYFTCAFH